MSRSSLAYLFMTEDPDPSSKDTRVSVNVLLCKGYPSKVSDLNAANEWAVTLMDILLKTFTQFLGAYHPQANGAEEMFHLQSKAAIVFHVTEKWTEILPAILLWIHASVKEDISATPAEMVFGSPL
ncbi:hypothetical protein TNIN_35291 [Trichonephila inaurata madagascariensis]|uniref:Uncharacterized protein n=1 Tax=Trichonephila inaurata madagascariensis TaxID=2747483 RepID=A0A8X6X842_9ARAC|nr:hypothetical protein TNIN_180051 [Trichonephila inaurata madagascariensis]GFY63321.1 hypothetical protein TNIN_35291 [Trichonephila inaurata madagascariensis]